MKRLILENEYLRMVVLPDYGAKISEITDKKANYQWMWEDPQRKLRERNYGDLFEKHDISGFDECFPNIGLGKYPGSESFPLPDHGELWTQKWSYLVDADSCTTYAKGVQLDYLFERKVTLRNNIFLFDYTITNLGVLPFKAFWSAHPLLNIANNLHILINGNPSMTKEFGFSGRMGQDGADGYSDHLKHYVWPLTQGKNGELHDLSTINLDVPLTDKVVIKSPEDGLVKIVNPQNKSSLSFKFDPEKIPYVGICYNINAWPFSGNKGAWLAIEPTQGATDILEESCKLNACLFLEPDCPFKFGFEMIFNPIT